MRLRATIGMLATAVVVAAGLAIDFMPRAVEVDVAEVKRAPLAVSV
jgi:HlyD family secretion protein